MRRKQVPHVLESMVQPPRLPTSASSRLALSMPATSAKVAVGTSLPLKLGLRFLP